MATAANPMSKRKRARYSAEYRAEALTLAERIGVAAAASVLGLHATHQRKSRTLPPDGRCPST